MKKYEETYAMRLKGWRFYICEKCGKQYPSKEGPNPSNLCLFCLQGRLELSKKLNKKV